MWWFEKVLRSLMYLNICSPFVGGSMSWRQALRVWSLTPFPASLCFMLVIQDVSSQILLQLPWQQLAPMLPSHDWLLAHWNCKLKHSSRIHLAYSYGFYHSIKKGTIKTREMVQRVKAPSLETPVWSLEPFCGRRELSLTSCPLISIFVLWHRCTPTHMCIQNKVFKIAYTGWDGSQHAPVGYVKQPWASALLPLSPKQPWGLGQQSRRLASSCGYALVCPFFH